MAWFDGRGVKGVPDGFCEMESWVAKKLVCAADDSEAFGSFPRVWLASEKLAWSTLYFCMVLL
jgi:hypothetical protein